MATGSPVGKLARQASPLFVGRVASTALTFVLPLALARLLDPSGFGTYKQLFLVSQTVLLVGQIGLSQSLYYFLPGGGRERGAYVVQTVGGLAFLAFFAGVALWCGAPWLGGWLGDGTLARLRTPLALLTAGTLAAAPIESALLSEGRVGAAAVSYFANDALRATALLVGARSGGIVGLAWGAACYAGARVLILGLLLVGRVLPLATPSMARFRAQLAYALPFAGSVLLYVAQRQFAPYAVSAYVTPGLFAVYSVALFHLPVVDIVFAPIAEVLVMRLSQLRAAEQGSAASTPEAAPAAVKGVPGGTRPADGSVASLAEWDDAVDKLASVLWPGAVMGWLVGGQLLPLLFTHRYDTSVPLFFLATLELPMWVYPVDGLLRARGDMRFLFVWNGVRAALTAGLVLAGIHLFGLSGAIGGGLVGEGLSRVVMLRRGRRTLGVARSLAAVPTLGPIGLATVLAALPAAAVRYGRSGWGGIIGAGLVYGLCYLGLRLGWYYRTRRQAQAEAQLQAGAAGA
ncbi:MAG TPA: polysaccharide biosynthesis C-terminal domain-containing protein [Polyangia bacterium]|jgi:O-antigen/teichoic acid export membrane protein|nr:polysaccharide biosynthesis C-terminal domain-containing protein [Polyangia bacterium]